MSRQRLDHFQLARKLIQMLQTCHPTNETSLKERLRLAQQGQGPTLFDWLVEIITDNQSHVTLERE